MEKPVLSPNFTIEDIHKLRDYNNRGWEVQRRLERMKAANV